MRALSERLLQTIRKQELLHAGDRVAAAVSGGADSVALLRLLLDLRAQLGIVLSVAHVNHKLRGEESDEDERFVATLAERHGLEVHMREARVGNQVTGIEVAARELRYGFFRELAREGRVAKIATAHTLDDQAETVLLRMFRGTGIRGLSGIHPRVVFQEKGSTFGEVVRPLLGFRRAVLLDCLREMGQDWRDDSSNQSTAFLRNRVRHRLFPVIAEEFGHAAVEHMGELAEIARAEEQWAADSERWRASTQNPIPSSQRTATSQAVLNVEELLARPLAMQRRLVRGWLEGSAPGLSISFRLIEEALELACGSAGRKLDIPAGWKLRRGRQELLLEPSPLAGRGEAADYQYSLAVPGAVEVRELGACIEARLVDAVAVPEQERNQLLDRERLPKQITIRNWRPGDRFWPVNTKSAKKVKDLLSDRHATGAEKKMWPVAAAEDGEVVWLRGFVVPAAWCAPASALQAIWIRQIEGMM